MNYNLIQNVLVKQKLNYLVHILLTIFNLVNNLLYIFLSQGLPFQHLPYHQIINTYLLNCVIVLTDFKLI